LPRLGKPPRGDENLIDVGLRLGGGRVVSIGISVAGFARSSQAPLDTGLRGWLEFNLPLFRTYFATPFVISID